MKVTGKIEAIAKEGEHGVPAGWHLVRVGGQDVLFQLGMSPGKVGDNVQVECVGSNIGLKAVSVEKSTADIGKSNDYTSLYNDCKRLLNNTKRSIWELGKRLIGVEKEYGKGTIQRLAKDLNVSDTYLYNCIAVAEKYPEFSTIVENVPWYKLVKSTVEKPRSPSSGKAGYTSTAPALPSNPPATPQELVDAYRIEPKPLPEAGGSGPEIIIHQFLGRLNIPYVSEVPIKTEDGKPAKPDFVIANNLILENTNDLHRWEKDLPRDKALAQEGRLVFRIHDDVLLAYRPPMEAKP